MTMAMAVAAAARRLPGPWRQPIASRRTGVVGLAPDPTWAAKTRKVGGAAGVRVALNHERSSDSIGSPV
jgi:hypothetical protein